MKKNFTRFIKAGLYSICLTMVSQVSAGNIVADYPKTAIDPNGNVVAVWEALDDVTNNWKIQTATFDPATTTWSTPSDIYAPVNQGAYTPNIVLKSSGDGLSVWIGLDFTTGNAMVQAAMYIAATNSWTAAQTLSDPATEYANSDIRISVNDAGVAVVTWSSYLYNDPIPTTAIRSVNAVIDSSNTWSSPIKISG